MTRPHQLGSSTEKLAKDGKKNTIQCNGFYFERGVRDDPLTLWKYNIIKGALQIKTIIDNLNIECLQDTCSYEITITEIIYV